MSHLPPASFARRHQEGRALPLVLVVVAVALIGILLIADPLGIMGGGESDDPYSASTEGGMLGVDTEPDADEGGELTGAGLAALYGEGDLGALKLRLRWVDGNRPVVDQAVLLRHRRGDDVATVASDERGLVTFGRVAPDRSYSVHIKGEGFKAVSIYGIKVRKGETTDAGTHLLGEKIVLRGRVVNMNGSPVAGADVIAQSGAPDMRPTGIVLRMTRMAMNPAPALDSAKSNDDGYFFLSKLDDGRYSLSARHGGYATDYKDDVIVRADRMANELVLRLGKAATLKGIVKDSNGKAVAGAEVRAMADRGWRGMMGGGLRYETAFTDDQGRYEIDTLAPSSEQSRARYRLGVMAKGFAPIFEATTIEVAEGETEVRDFVLPLGGTIEGLVTDKRTGKPVADAEVAAIVGNVMMGRRRGRGNNDDGPPPQGMALMTRTDKEGRFRFENVVPGPIFSAQVEAYGYVTGNFSNQFGQTSGWPDVEADEVIEVNAELEAGGVVQGRVTDGDGNGLPGATVAVESMRSFFTGAPSTLSDENGDFELAGVDQGTYTLRATLAGYAPANEGGTVSVEMPESGGLVKADLSMVQAGTVVGVVSDAAGEPVPGVRLQVYQVAEEGDQGGGNNRMRRAGRWRQQIGAPVDMSDAEGRFRLSGIQEGRWKIVGTSEGYVRSESKAFRIAVGEELEVNFAMQAGGILRIRVTGEGGRGLEGATVSTMYLDEPNRRVNAFELRGMGRGGNRSIANESGEVVIEDLQPGSTVIEVRAEGYVTKIRRNIQVIADQEVILPMAMSKGETVRGVVLDPEGKPVSRAWIRVTADRNPARGWGGGANEETTEPQGDEIEPIYSGRTDDEGRFEVTNVPRGTYTVYVGMAPGHVAWMGAGNEVEAQKAIKRAVGVPASELTFNLAKAPAGANNNPFGGGRRGR